MMGWEVREWKYSGCKDSLYRQEGETSAGAFEQLCTAWPGCVHGRLPISLDHGRETRIDKLVEPSTADA